MQIIWRGSFLLYQKQVNICFTRTLFGRTDNGIVKGSFGVVHINTQYKNTGAPGKNPVHAPVLETPHAKKR